MTLASKQMMQALVLVLVSATVSAVVTLAIVGRIDAPTAHAATETPIVLRSTTPVIHEWRDARGRVVGQYETTLFDYADDTAALEDLSTFRDELSTVVHYLVTDEEMRGHLVRHGLDVEQLDYIAAHFEADPELQQYLAYPGE